MQRQMQEITEEEAAVRAEMGELALRLEGVDRDAPQHHSWKLLPDYAIRKLAVGPPTTGLLGPELAAGRHAPGLRTCAERREQIAGGSVAYSARFCAELLCNGDEPNAVVIRGPDVVQAVHQGSPKAVKLPHTSFLALASPKSRF